MILPPDITPHNKATSSAQGLRLRLEIRLVTGLKNRDKLHLWLWRTWTTMAIGYGGPWLWRNRTDPKSEW